MRLSVIIRPLLAALLAACCCCAKLANVQLTLTPDEALAAQLVRDHQLLTLDECERVPLTELGDARWEADPTHGAPPHRAPSPRCTAESMHHVWHRR